MAAGDGAAADGPALQPPQTAAPATAPAAATPFRPKPEVLPGEPEPVDPPEGELDEDDLENSMSLAAIEADLKPKVLETFDNVADSYKRLRRLQDQDIENRLRNEKLTPHQERKYKKLKDDIIAEVKSLRLNQARIDSLVEQLYDINKRLVGYEGRMMRLAESHGVVREDFLKNQVGYAPRLEFLDLCDVVHQEGHPALDRRSGPHHPHPGAHDRDNQQDRARLAPDAPRDRSRADPGGACREARHAAREGAQGAENRQGADLPRDPDRRRGGLPPRRFHRGQERGAADRRCHPVEPARYHDAGARLAHPARGTRAAHALRHRHEHRPHAGGGRPAVLGDARTHPPDRGQGAAQAEASVAEQEAEELFG